MADEILTGKNVNEAKKKVTDEEVNKLLKDAQKQLKKDINVELTSEERAHKLIIMNNLIKRKLNMPKLMR